MDASLIDAVTQTPEIPACYDGPAERAAETPVEKGRRVEIYLPPEAMLHTFTDESTDRYSLACVQLDREKGRLVATNGRIAVTCRLPGLEDIPIGLPRVLLLAKGFGRAEILWKKSGGKLFLICERLGESPATWSIECRFSRDSRNVMWSLPLETMGGMYPNIDAAINETSGNSQRILLCPQFLNAIADHACSFSECNSIAVNINPTDLAKPIRVAPTRDEDSDAECIYVLMPMVEDLPAIAPKPVAQDAPEKADSPPVEAATHRLWFRWEGKYEIELTGSFAEVMACVSECQDVQRDWVITDLGAVFVCSGKVPKRFAAQACSL
ncbi:hypothetical protein Poly21_01680 [Allorhodopirellula heiligendammensis]|uniref:Uncharacterized protein n=2 Tax=Allorhodopirellula heiligendammensis TaxID=2714739 RepID=A0A5C6C1M2_9BACT|nr:hypothetical protein Poly21_01680 [Allorhodopirellula heiligendammensis]